jgi:hypothetical protein
MTFQTVVVADCGCDCGDAVGVQVLDEAWYR